MRNLIKNFLFLLKYPFYKVYDVTGHFLGYNVNWYESIPEGWRIAFGKEFSDELLEALKKDNALGTFRFTDIKEKFGGLRFDSYGFGENTDFVLTKYEYKSLLYCIGCGKPARYITTGWISYICEDCAEMLKPHTSVRLTKDDIPEVISYEKERKQNIILKEKYGLDFTKGWGLK